MHFRLSREVTNELINRFAASQIFLALQAYAGYEPISPEKHIISFLWYVGHESSGYRDVADKFGITISALYNVISRITNFLISLAPNVIRFPTMQEREAIKEHFLQMQNRFPGVIGAIDGSHIRIDKPIEDKDLYINRKQFFSIQLQGIVNHGQKFMNVFIGYSGSVHDARVFRESPVYNRLNELCGEDGYLLGDSAYPCLQRLIVSYRDNGHLTRAQINFNQRLSSCRVIIENAFGNLKQRFRQLYHFKLRDIVRMVQVVHACCVLHNMANANDLQLFEPPPDENQPDPDAVNALINMVGDNAIPQDNQQGRELRDEICRQLAAQ
ncbi:putative nuclease HARBI1 [Nylanderia fulva]|uniref:putative nuclease HARBI1 n=3 Tax=Nylanderia fulva TaxID=613905 RepID=UPI0010FB4F51|nr:putative nuclease HARBI1 [Nylanderia fulva]XP_029157948.1 putative nuclease HARBI1 [Nylanderia fulva]XP_029162647.1 putative nuclease HARBI1 [Nylanderia fulva]XP_029162648.1 putative nuclease HARBI1 [Nylanderia fulva]XP_029162908.1 putative nuclease HARBI1 [Nylanderia fulva]XP_029162909.1 putative nuclease HARBI1 [Nylanderia fulva]XP_029162910.1 putative nuclease HARBI1 [Nylanderia fulva]XP_029162911.1 putative nuclease HARBI1 [Nylanderia fulva]XP_029163663.1 putative nuclease HARBI1 [Ny